MYGYYPYGAYYNMQYLIYILPGLILALIAQAKIQKAYGKYSRVDSGTGLTGRDVAQILLQRHGIYDVRIEPIKGQLTDHYDPRGPVLRLSEGVYNSTSVAALSIAAHEVGHAIQDETNYYAYNLRSRLVPLANIGSQFSFILILIGLFMAPSLVRLGIYLFSATVLFQLVTLPVELNASKRAKLALADGILPEEHVGQAGEVLGAAALTYVASLVSAIGALLRLMAMTNGDRRR